MMDCAFGRQITNSLMPEPACPNPATRLLVVRDGDDKRVFNLCEQHEEQLDLLGVLDP